MSQQNPYDKFLASRDPMDVITKTEGRIAGILNALDPEHLNESPAPGKWSVREIVCHLADCEMVFAFRLRQTLSEDRHVIQPFDQEKWAANYSAYALSAALAVFGAVRSWNLALLKSVSAESHAKQVSHPERGTMTFQTIVETMAGHDLNHLEHLERIARTFAGTH